MRQITFRYDLLSYNGLKLGEVDMDDASVDMDSEADICRTARFQIHGRQWRDINFLTDRICPHVVIRDKGIVTDDPLGVFLLTSPSRSTTQTGTVVRVEAYDRAQILVEDRIEDRLYFPAGYLYTSALSRIIQSAGIPDAVIETSDKVLRRAREWEIGTQKLQIINDLLRELNYNKLYSDATGALKCTRYRAPWQRQAEIVYDPDDLSAYMLPSGATSEIDLFAVPNVWVCTASNGESDALVSRCENNNPTSQTSISARKRRIVHFENISDIADQESLDAYTQRMAYKDSNIYEVFEFSTLINPKHGYQTPVQIRHPRMEIDGKYIEHGWSIPLNVGGHMIHKARRIIQV